MLFVAYRYDRRVRQEFLEGLLGGMSLEWNVVVPGIVMGIAPYHYICHLMLLEQGEEDFRIPAGNRDGLQVRFR